MTDPKTPVLFSCEVAGFDRQNGTAWVPTSSVHTNKLMTLVEDVARSQTKAPDGASVMCDNVAAQSVHNPQEWINRRMAPNCGPSFDLRNVTSYNKFQCYYDGEGVIDGQRVRRPLYHVDGQLPSCDGMDGGGGAISDSVMSAIKQIAYEKAGGDEAQLDPEKFVCFVQSLPFH